MTKLLVALVALAACTTPQEDRAADCAIVGRLSPYHHSDHAPSPAVVRATLELWPWTDDTVRDMAHEAVEAMGRRRGGWTGYPAFGGDPLLELARYCHEYH